MLNHKVLVIIDAQNDFITGALANKEAQAAVPNIVKLIEKNEWSAIFTTQDTHDKNYLNTKEGEKLPVPHCIWGTMGHRIEESIWVALDEAVDGNIKVVHSSKSTFGSRVLADLIAETIAFYPGDTLDITVCGFCTDICVVSNVLNLKMEFAHTADINVVANACAGVTPESHEAALTVMKSCQINII